MKQSGELWFFVLSEVSCNDIGLGNIEDTCSLCNSESVLLCGGSTAVREEPVDNGSGLVLVSRMGSQSSLFQSKLQRLKLVEYSTLSWCLLEYHGQGMDAGGNTFDSGVAAAMRSPLATRVRDASGVQGAAFAVIDRRNF
ncbi:hypothetical protein MSG28_011346 [Choristoneura fumiferana]|uniref:Uncharacterized protein n=1 Tax=Choristoneura fumiferana TaxID=7141 RepID=A0ACC0JNQ0_CHOFU|nr:hypothetical protein MSG28_011346 [Choristoneura fumiferana]